MERDFDWLLREYDWHGCRLPAHAVEQAALEWGVSASGVSTWFRRRLDELESAQPRRSFAAVAGLADILLLVGHCEDGPTGYRLLQEFDAAPVTQHIFFIWVLMSPLFPELEGLANREILAVNLQARGGGRRACLACRAWMGR